MANNYTISPSFVTDVRESTFGVMPKADNSSVGSDLSTGWRGFADIVNRSVKAGKLYTTDIVSTYSLLHTNSSGAYVGGVLAPNGDIHFIPRSAVVGQKIDASGVVSTYSLVYTTTNAYQGGVLAPNGDIHFVPRSAVVGQKISAASVVSTYSLVYTTNLAYRGGVLAPNGDIHFVPLAANRGQKISTVASSTFDSAICMSPWFNKL